MSVTLVHPQAQLAVSATRLIDKCTLFKNNLALVGAPYLLKSPVPVDVVQSFISAVTDDTVKITNANFAGLLLLCTEFGFDALAGRLAEFSGETPDVEVRIAELEERSLAHGRDIAALQAEIARLSAVIESVHCAEGTREDQRRVRDPFPSHAAARRAREQTAASAVFHCDAGRGFARESVRSSPASFAGCALRFADRRGLPIALRRVPREALYAAVARQPRRLRRQRLSQALRQSREHTDCNRGHGAENFRRLHAGAVAIDGHSFHIEESARPAGEEI
jgi:hypothetical protein